MKYFTLNRTESINELKRYLYCIPLAKHKRPSTDLFALSVLILSTLVQREILPLLNHHKHIGDNFCFDNLNFIFNSHCGVITFSVVTIFTLGQPKSPLPSRLTTSTSLVLNLLSHLSVTLNTTHYHIEFDSRRPSWPLQKSASEDPIV